MAIKFVKLSSFVNPGTDIYNAAYKGWIAHVYKIDNHWKASVSCPSCQEFERFEDEFETHIQAMKKSKRRINDELAQLEQKKAQSGNKTNKSKGKLNL